MSKDKGYTVQVSGCRKPKKTTHGWNIEVEFQDRTTTWRNMKSVRDANPIKLVEYVVANRIDDIPAFAWRVPYYLKKKSE